MMTRLLREPLLHFLLIGAALFVLYDQLNPAESSEDSQQIVVSAGRIRQLAGIFAKTWQRPPTSAELQGLVDEFVLEEAWYRQAMEMGLDRDDTIVRRRLRQKLEFLTGDTISMAEPSEEDLQEYLTEHADQFREPGRWTFRQVYFSPERHGEDPERRIAEKLTAFRAGDTEDGDSSLLPETYDAVAPAAMDATFGSGFSDQLKTLESGSWQGPVRSGLGYHLVRIDRFAPGRLPTLAEIRPAVLREWSSEKRLSVRTDLNASLLKQYEVLVEWPQDDSGAADTVDETP